jgi:hypothetical protein
MIMMLCSSTFLFVSQMSNLIGLLRNKGYPLKIYNKKGLEGYLSNQTSFLGGGGISTFGIIQMILNEGGG